MKSSSRALVYSILIYSGILGVVLIILSIFSLIAYGCGFEFRSSSVIYMLYLIYYRTERCDGRIDWIRLDGINQHIPVQPVMPSETNAVLRTLIFSGFYLLLAILLVITCILGLAGMRRIGKSRHLTFWLYFAPFIIIFIAIIIMDLVSSGFYLFEYFLTLRVSGLMSLMEIRNSEIIGPIFENVAMSTRSLPSMIMFAGASKCLLFLILNIYLAIVIGPATWTVAQENEEFIKIIRRDSIRSTSNNVQDVNLRVGQEQIEEAPRSSRSFGRSSSYQRSSNPYMDINKRETHL